MGDEFRHYRNLGNFTQIQANEGKGEVDLPILSISCVNAT